MPSDEIPATVHELLNTKRAWTWGSMARDKRNNSCSPFAAKARCWCVAGAIERVYLRRDQERLEAYGKIASKIREKFKDIDNKWRVRYDKVEGPSEAQLIEYVNDVYGYDKIMKIVKEVGV